MADQTSNSRTPAPEPARPAPAEYADEVRKAEMIITNNGW